MIALEPLSRLNGLLRCMRSQLGVNAQGPQQDKRIERQESSNLPAREAAASTR